MKLINSCLVAALALGLASCGGKDPKEVKKIYDNTDDLTQEQIATALDWYIEYQEEQIDELEDALDDAEDLYIDSKAKEAAAKVYAQSQIDDSEVQESKAYKERKDELKENKQKIKNLRKKLLRKIDDLADKYDYDDPKVGDIDDDDDD